MKLSLVIFSLLLITSCNTKNKKQDKPTWLYGNWERINEKPNKKTFDFWNKNLTGIGFTLQEKDTIFKEKMKIVSLRDTLYLKVNGVNETPTFFKFTEQTNSSFVCENLKNDFPKKIYYYLENKQLKCEISNNEFSVNFIFEKIISDE